MFRGNEPETEEVGVSSQLVQREATCVLWFTYAFWWGIASSKEGAGGWGELKMRRLSLVAAVSGINLAEA